MKTDTDILEIHHLKKTGPRKSILAVLEEEKDPLSASEITSRLEGTPDLSTVYRTLLSFSHAAIVRKERRTDGTSAFSLIRPAHRHVLICLSCQKRVYLDHCPFHAAEEEIKAETGFIIEDHPLEIYGLCPDCQKKA